VLRRIFGPKIDEVKGGLRKLHNEEFHNLYSSPSIIRMVKTRRIRWTAYVARMGRTECIYNIVWKARRKGSLERPATAKVVYVHKGRRSRSPRGLRHVLSSLCRKAESWVRILHKAWMFGRCIYLFCVCVVLCLGRGLATS
jgi:hypothetical protein